MPTAHPDATPPLRARLDEWLALGLPAREIAPSRRRRIQVITVVTLLMTVFGLVFVGWFLWIGAPLISGVAGLAMVAGLGNLALLRSTRNTQIAGIIGTSAVLLLLLASSLLLGGFSSPSFGALYVVPMLAALLVDARAGWAFAGVVMAAVAAFWGLEQAGLVVPDLAAGHPLQGLLSRIATVLTIGTVMVALASRDGTWSERHSALGLDADNEPTDGYERPPLVSPITRQDEYTDDMPTAPQHRPLRLLVLDDSLPTLLWIQGELAEHEVSVTTDAREATADFVEGGYDVLLCSLEMPYIRGEDVHHAIRSIDPHRARRMVFMVGGTAPVDTSAFAGGEAVSVLRKPLDADELRSTLQLTRHTG